MQYTTVLNLKKPEGTDTVNIDDFNYNANIIDGLAGTGRTTETIKGNTDSINNLAGTGRTTETVKGNSDALNTHAADYVKHPGYAVTTGSANTYVATLTPAPTSYGDGMGIVVKINVASTGASTLNINNLGAKAILDTLGNALTTTNNLKLNQPYTLRYNGTAFILQGKGGGGNTIASHVLVGETATVDSGPIIGTAPLKSGVTYTPTTSDQTITTGWEDGTCKVLGDAGLTAGNIKTGINIFGVAGTYDTEASVPITAATVLSGKKGWVNGALVTGTMANLVGSSLGSGTPINGVSGGSKYDFDILLPASGYVTTATKVHQTLTNLTPANFVSGVTIPELSFTGTATITSLGGKRTASGSGTTTVPSSGSMGFTVSGLSFTPSTVIVVSTNATYGTAIYMKSSIGEGYGYNKYDGSYWNNSGGPWNSNITMNSGGFTITNMVWLYYPNNVDNYNWIAYE